MSGYGRLPYYRKMNSVPEITTMNERDEQPTTNDERPMFVVRRWSSAGILNNSTIRILLLLLVLFAFGLRVWRLDQAPPGWRDDELIEALVISQKVLEGDIQVYYPDASGHEALYHILAAGMLRLFGPGVAGIRWLSAILGTLTIPLTYLIGRRLFNPAIGLLAAALLAVSFWSLMYSRFGIRHINMPVLMLATFYPFLKGLNIGHQPAENDNERPLTNDQRPTTDDQRPAFAVRRSPFTIHNFTLAGLFMGLNFYTYFAARGIPLILFGYCVYLGLFARPRLRRHWRGLLLMFGLAFLLALPLAVTLSRQPEAEARLTEVGKPLTDALAGDYALLWENTVRTLNMFHSDGDDEWLYNIPFRPLFSLPVALLFWTGVLIAGWYTVRPLLFWRRTADRQQTSHSLVCAFLFLWWLAGITPGFLSIPAASLSHTIAAQPAVYLLLALPVWGLGRLANLPGGRLALLLVAVALVTAVAGRDLPDYFQRWPQRGMVRFLYRADIQAVARYVNEYPDFTDFGVTSLLAGPWDKLALAIDVKEATAVRPRWYDPGRVLLLQPAVTFYAASFAQPFERSLRPMPAPVPGAYNLGMIEHDLNLTREFLCFDNGLCLLAAEYDRENGRLEIAWQVVRPLDLPPLPVISHPAPPGVYAGPRLSVFAHLLGPDGELLLVDDGLWIDVESLHPGDLFVQLHWLPAPQPTNAHRVQFGLYDPMSGERILTADGRDRVIID
jgi:4-amino-4-deoxy-L-arabinose transferase-like glycosyltransferase